MTDGDIAKIALAVEGAIEAASQVRKVKEEVGGLGGAANKAERALSDVGKAIYHMASDAAKAMNDVKPISFAAAADSVKQFDDVVTRMAIRSGKEVGALRERFMAVGVQIGVMPQKVAEVTRALGRMTSSTEAADAIKALGDEANDTDRDLGEMAELGATLYSKLGVPMDKIGDAIRRVHKVASDFQFVGGHMALEDSLVRLGPLLANLGLGMRGSTALVGALSKGKSPQVAQETNEAILSTLSGVNPILLTRKMRQLTGQRDYKPYTVDESGRVVPKAEVLPTLQRNLKGLPTSAVYGFFGQSQRGVQAAEAFLHLDYSKVADEDEDLALQEAAEKARRVRTRSEQQHRPGAPSSMQQRALLFEGLDLTSRGGNKFSQTAAGRRAQTAVERGNVELGVGQVVQEQRDKRNNLYARHRTEQAAVDTLKAYLPSYIQKAADLAEAAGVQAETHLRSLPVQSARPVVDLSPSSIKGIASAVSAAPPAQLRPAKSAAAQAVEDSKAKGRGSANF